MERKSIKNGIKTISDGLKEVGIATIQHIVRMVVRIAKSIYKSFKEICYEIDLFVNAKPWIAIMIFVIFTFSLCMSYMIECRAERNTADARLYDIQKKYDTLKICLEK